MRLRVIVPRPLSGQKENQVIEYDIKERKLAGERFWFYGGLYEVEGE